MMRAKESRVGEEGVGIDLGGRKRIDTSRGCSSVSGRVIGELGEVSLGHGDRGGAVALLRLTEWGGSLGAKVSHRAHRSHLAGEVLNGGGGSAESTLSGWINPTHALHGGEESA